MIMGHQQQQQVMVKMIKFNFVSKTGDTEVYKLQSLLEATVKLLIENDIITESDLLKLMLITDKKEEKLRKEKMIKPRLIKRVRITKKI